LFSPPIRDYETSRYPARPRSTPRETVAFLLEQRGLKPSGLWPAIGSKGGVFEILAGKRAIGKAQPKKLAEFFGVRADLFLRAAARRHTGQQRPLAHRRNLPEARRLEEDLSAGRGPAG
jgi:hypothetical protein